MKKKCFSVCKHSSLASVNEYWAKHVQMYTYARNIKLVEDRRLWRLTWLFHNGLKVSFFLLCHRDLDVSVVSRIVNVFLGLFLQNILCGLQNTSVYSCTGQLYFGFKDDNTFFELFFLYNLFTKSTGKIHCRYEAPREEPREAHDYLALG
jgi:hypothetical protein